MSTEDFSGCTHPQLEPRVVCVVFFALVDESLGAHNTGVVGLGKVGGVEVQASKVPPATL